jgi:hypothetical protein
MADRRGREGRRRDRRIEKSLRTVERARTSAEKTMKEAEDAFGASGARLDDAVRHAAAKRVGDELRHIDRQVEETVRAAETAVEDARRRLVRRPPPGRPARRGRRRVGGWLRHPIAALRTAMRARRYRRWLRKLERRLRRRTMKAEEQSSAALLAILTERIARTAAAPESGDEVAYSMEVAQVVIARYQEDAARLGDQRDRARARLTDWEERADHLAHTGRPELAAQARTHVSRWRRVEAETAAALAEYDVGRRRLADALDQLTALARRGG